MSEQLLKIEGLISTYGLIKAVKGISLHVEKGELVSLVGANGAGKSTLIKSILGLVTIQEGSILYEGEELVKEKYYNISKKGIAVCPEGRKVLSGFTVEENLELGSYSRPKDIALDKKILEQVYNYFPRLKERRKQLGGTLSGGEQQMLAVGRALMADPKLLLLDEPSMGLAPSLVNQVFEIIRCIKETGVTILLVEQNANKALKVSDRVYVMRTGEIVTEDTPKNLLENKTLLEAYLE